MREFKLQFVEVESGIQVRAHWNEDMRGQASNKENKLAAVIKPMIDTILQEVVPMVAELELVGVGNGNTTEEALEDLEYEKEKGKRNGDDIFKRY